MDITNAYCEVMRASLLKRHAKGEKMRGVVPYWRAKVGPNAKLWTGEDNVEYMQGLVQGGPTSSSGFSSTIHYKVKEADIRLAECGGCARFGMENGYLIGPKEVIFDVLAEFAEGIRRDHGCALNTRKCTTEGVCGRRESAQQREKTDIYRGNLSTSRRELT